MKNTPKQLLTASALLAGLVGFSSITQAADIDWDNGGATGLWSTNTNWVGDTLPGAADTARIGHPFGTNPATVDHATGTHTVATLEVGKGFGSAGTGTLDVTGGTLNTTNLTVGQYNSSVGSINVDGGALVITNDANLGDTANGTLSLSNGSVSFTDTAQLAFVQFGFGAGTGTIDISGGAWSGGRFNMGNGGTSVFNLSNSTATFNAYGFQTGGAGTQTFDLTTDANGITQLNTTVFTLGGTSDILNIDLSNYNIANGTSLTLVDAEFSNIAAMGTFDSVNIFGGTGTLNYTNDGSGAIITLDGITVVPEPSTYALLGGCFALSAVMLRRRQR